jgi:hypothetical protein
MTESATRETLGTIRPIHKQLAEVLGLPAADVVGAALAIAFVVRTDDPGRLFLSGVTPDFATAAIESLGGTVRVEPASESTGTGPSEGTVLIAADEVWSPAGGGATDDGLAVGFGPVALAATADPSRFANACRLTVTAGRPPERSRLERAEHLRTMFSSVAARLADEMAPAVDWSVLARTSGPSRAWMVEALTGIATTRAAAGSSLIDQADELDDERIDQLGDGYVRTAELWRYLAGGDLSVGPELHELERSCVAWMRGAAARPTRYAF